MAEKRGIPILHGQIPTGTFLNITLHAAANQQPARDVLVEAFEDSNLAHHAYNVLYFRWALLYKPDPDGRDYYMSVLSTSKDLPPNRSSVTGRQETNKTVAGHPVDAKTRHKATEPEVPAGAHADLLLLCRSHARFQVGQQPIDFVGFL